MQDDEMPGSAIRAFFEAPENKNLFSACPVRPWLAELREFPNNSVNIILAHMLGHILDYRAGPGCVDSGRTPPGINLTGLDTELRGIYNDCNNASFNEARKLDPNVSTRDKPDYQGFGPEQRGCFGADAQSELIAEAIRAYLQNPNYIKTVAPTVAARIRDSVNANPELNKVIQFN